MDMNKDMERGNCEDPRPMMRGQGSCSMLSKFPLSLLSRSLCLSPSMQS